jgi:ribonucleoside-diphosphate reductase alpha chain
MDITVIKREHDGKEKREPLDLEKIHRVLTWGQEERKSENGSVALPALRVSVSQTELQAKLKFFDGIRTEDIHDTLIKTAADLISAENPDYQFYSARLELVGTGKPPS